MRSLTLSFLFCISLVGGLVAQDYSFSQYNLAPVHLNPALTGSQDAKLRAFATYRNQWSQVLRSDSYNLYTVSADSRKSLTGGNYFGFGFSGHRDIAGSVRSGTTQGNISFAYGQLIDQSKTAEHYLIGAAQFGIAQKSADFSQVRWPADPPPSIDFVAQNFLIADLSAGLTWTSMFSERKRFYVGYAAHHLNRPNVSFLADTVSELSIRTTVHGAAELPLTTQLSVLPSFLYLRQGEHRQLLSGANVRLNGIGQNGYIQAGLAYRTGGALFSDVSTLVFTASAGLGDLVIGLSYDYSINELQQAGTPAGATELTLGYVLGQRTEGLSRTW